MKKLLVLALAWVGTLIPLLVLFGVGGTICWFAFGKDYGVFLFKLAFLVLLPAFAGARALFLSGPVPWGYDITESDAPRLFELIREVESAACAPYVRHVKLVADFNCAVVQQSRYGVLGVHENYLLLGVPLMLSLTPLQFKAVLAHEYGHISRQHGVLAARIGAFYNAWEQLLTALQRRTGPMVRIFSLFYRWYVPVFNRLSFSLRREHEREADLFAASIAGHAQAAVALAASQIRARFVDERFWQKLDRVTIVEPKPPPDLYARMSIVSRGAIGDPDRFLQEALGETIDPCSSHPPLRERIASLEISLEDVARAVSLPLETDAATQFLGDGRDALLRSVARDFISDNLEVWRRMHADRSQVRDALGGLDEIAERDGLSAEQESRRAVLSALTEREDARSLLASAAQRNPTDETVAMWLAANLAASHDIAAVPLLERLMHGEIDPYWAVQRLIEFQLTRGHYAEADALRETLAAVRSNNHVAEEEPALA